MIQIIEHNETLIRLSVFIGLLAGLMLLEALFARKKRVLARGPRWATNIGINVIYTVLVRLIFPIAATGVALFALSKGWGLLNLLAMPPLSMPLWAHILVSVILLDLAIYWQHVASHKIPMLWAFHQMHHADRDIDATTAIRFHPIEIILSLLYKMLIILIVGPHIIGVILFEIMLNGWAIFNHANLKIPGKVDKIIRTVFVTPDMHRVHHSVIKSETDSNYGFNLSLWDKIFGTYTDQPQEGHDGMTIGLSQYQSKAPSNIVWCLTLPFKKIMNRKTK